MTFLFLSIAAAALLNAGRLSIAKACVRTARMVRKACKVRVAFVR